MCLHFVCVCVILMLEKIRYCWSMHNVLHYFELMRKHKSPWKITNFGSFCLPTKRCCAWNNNLLNFWSNYSIQINPHMRDSESTKFASSASSFHWKKDCICGNCIFQTLGSSIVINILNMHSEWPKWSFEYAECSKVRNLFQLARLERPLF